MKNPFVQQTGDRWWDRNWKWFAPLVVLGGLLAFAGFAAILIFFVFGIIKSSDVYNLALTSAKENPLVIEALGKPIEEKFYVLGNVNVSGSSGDADLTIPISGPNNKATIYAVASKSAGIWNYSVLFVEIKNSGQRINLLE